MSGLSPLTSNEIGKTSISVDESAQIYVKMFDNNEL